MGDLNEKKTSKAIKLTNSAEDMFADVVLDSGENKLLTKTTLSATVPLGKDPIPDSWFQIINTGAAGDTIRIQLAATANDPSTPDRDLPAFDKTFTVVAGEVGDEVKLGKRIVSELKTDTGASNSEIRGQFIKDDENAVVFITSKKRGAFFERAAVNDFQVTVTGTASITLGFNNFIQREKQVELARSLDDPRQGVQAISGSVTAEPGGIGFLFQEFAEDGGGSSDLSIDGSVTPVTFSIDAIADKDIFIDKLVFSSSAGAIQFGKFIEVDALTTGMVISIRSEDTVFTFPTFKTIDHLVESFGIGKYIIELGAGDANFNVTFELGTPFPLRSIGTFTTDDYIQVVINDDLSTSSIKLMHLQAFGFTREV